MFPFLNLSSNTNLIHMSLSVHGRDVKTVILQPLEESHIHQGKNTVTYEARLLKALFLRLQMY